LKKIFFLVNSFEIEEMERQGSGIIETRDFSLKNDERIYFIPTLNSKMYSSDTRDLIQRKLLGH